MKPVLILQNMSGDGPAYLGTWLARVGAVVDVRRAEAGEPFPEDLQGYGALALLGGEMGANDPLPSLRRAEALFLQALREGVPTLGHCLGGQLMARALGATVAASPAPEIGWHRIEVSSRASAQAWLGAAAEQTVFQWHYDAFDLPAGATALASSAACACQAFALGPHLALQFHVELDAEKLGRWCLEDSQRYRDAAALHRSVQSGPEMLQAAASALAAQQALADRIYARWWAAAAGR